MSDIPSVIAAVGMGFEAHIASGPGVAVVRCARSATARARLEAAVARGARGIISFGIAGGLDPALRPGDAIVATAVRHQDHAWAADEKWTRTMLRKVAGARTGAILGADAPVATAQDKQALHHTFDVAAVDTESHIVAETAASCGVPFAVFRVVADDAQSTLPQAALAGFGSGGRVNVFAVIRGLVRAPGELAPLIRLARHTSAARRRLARGRRDLGPSFGLFDFA